MHQWRFLFFDASIVSISNAEITACDEAVTNPAVLRTIAAMTPAPTKKKLPLALLQRQALKIIAELSTASLDEERTPNAPEQTSENQ